MRESVETEQHVQRSLRRHLLLDGRGNGGIAQKRLRPVDGVVYGFEIALLFNLRERVQIGFGKRRKREGGNVVQLGFRRKRTGTMV